MTQHSCHFYSFECLLQFINISITIIIHCSYIYHDYSIVTITDFPLKEFTNFLFQIVLKLQNKAKDYAFSNVHTKLRLTII